MKNGKICVRILCSNNNSPRKTQLEMVYHPWFLCIDCKVSAIFHSVYVLKILLGDLEKSKLHSQAHKYAVCFSPMSVRMLLPSVEISRILLLIGHML